MSTFLLFLSPFILFDRLRIKVKTSREGYLFGGLTLCIFFDEASYTYNCDTTVPVFTAALRSFPD